MIAIVKTKAGEGNVELLEAPNPVPSPKQALIKVHAAGICGTDIKIKNGCAWCNPPVILGHEFSGTVCAVGAEVSGLKEGDRVTAETAEIVCGRCYFCRTGNYLMCPDRLSIGYGTDGAMAEYIRIRADIVHKLPDNVSLDCAALCEPSAVAIHAVYDSARVVSTDVAVVFGCGAIGNLVAQTAKSLGAEVIIAGLGKDGRRLALARETGADHCVNLEKQDLASLVSDITGGRGADIVFECSGSSEAVMDGMKLLRRRGTLVQVGLTAKELKIEYSLLTAKEIKLAGTFGHRWESWDTALKLISAGKLKTEPLISHRFPLEQWERGFAAAESGEGMKILLYPGRKSF